MFVKKILEECREKSIGIEILDIPSVSKVEVNGLPFHTSRGVYIKMIGDEGTLRIRKEERELTFKFEDINSLVLFEAKYQPFDGRPELQKFIEFRRD